MRVRHLAPFLAGLLVAFVLAGFPASAADATIAANGTLWLPSTTTIQPGGSVTWTNAGGGFHNVCVAAAGAASGCDEFRSGDPNSSWPAQGYTHTFASAGTYKFICEQHAPGMTGTVTVGDGGGTTTTSTTTTTTTTTTTSTTTTTGTTPTTTATQPTQTVTTPTQTEQTSAAGDTTAPRFTGKPRRRASRKALVLEIRSSEVAVLKVAVLRRPPQGRSFARVSEASVHVQQGRNVVKVPRARPRSGAYRIKLQLVDAAGNKSAVTTLSFKIA
jgi:plastocyanin